MNISNPSKSFFLYILIPSFAAFSIHWQLLSPVLSLYKSSSLEDCYGFCEYSYAFMGLVLAILQFKLWLHLKCWRLWFCLKGFEHCFLLKSSFQQRIKGGNIYLKRLSDDGSSYLLKNKNSERSPSYPSQQHFS